MKGSREHRRQQTPRRAHRHQFRVADISAGCVRCGQKFLAFYMTGRCVCWKMRLPRQKDVPLLEDAPPQAQGEVR